MFVRASSRSATVPSQPLTETWGGSGRWTARYGVVQTVDFNGEDAMITSLELDPQAGTITQEVFGTNTDLKIFSATPEEIDLAFTDASAVLERKADTARAEADKAAQAVTYLGRVRQSVEASAIHSPETAPAAIQGTTVD